MKAAAFIGKKDIQLVDVEDAKACDDGVLIEVHACGICGSDIHVYNSDLLTEASTKIIDDYRIIGHEFTGEVIEVGRHAEGRVNRDLLISHTLPLSDAAEGFALQANPAESMKVIITMK